MLQVLTLNSFDMHVGKNAGYKYSVEPEKAKGSYWDVTARLLQGALGTERFDTLVFVGCAGLTTYRLLRARVDLSGYRMVFVDPEWLDTWAQFDEKVQASELHKHAFDLDCCLSPEMGKSLVSWDAFVGLDPVSPPQPAFNVRLALKGSVCVEHYAHTTVAMRVVK